MKSETTEVVEWAELSPQLDELVGRLRHRDRQAILLRFYEQKSYPEIGMEMAISEEAARKRVERAVEQLRESFARRGVMVGAGTLATSMSVNLTQPASASQIVGATAAPTQITSVATTAIAKSTSALLTWLGLKPVVMSMMAIIFASVIGTAILQLTKSPQEALAAPTTNSSIRLGRLISSDDKPIAGASVYLMQSDPYADGLRTLAQVTSDADGRFEFSSQIPADGRISVLARASGFGLTIAKLSDPDDNEPAETTMSPATDLRVRFVGPNGNPASGLKVFIRTILQGRLHAAYASLSPELKQELAQTTDSQGVCVFPSLPQDGEIAFDIDDDRYARLYLEQQIKLAERPSTDGAAIVLSYAGTLSGRVTYADSQKPVAGIPIIASSITQNNGINPAPEGYGASLTDENGNYVIRKLLPENYRVIAILTPKMLAHAAATEPDNIRVVANNNSAADDIKLITGGIIQGKVTAAGNHKLPSNFMMNTVPLAEDGSYLYHVVPGHRRVYMSNQAPAGLLEPDPRFYDVDVADGATTTVNFQFREDPAPSVTGTVVDSDGKPVRGATVSVTRSDQPAFFAGRETTRTDGSGNFSFPALPSGTSLQATKNRWTTIDPVIVNNEHRNLKLVLHKDALSSVLVKLLLPDGTPAVGANVTLMQMQGRGGMGVEEKFAGADGNVVFRSLQPNIRYDLWAGGKGFGRKQVERLPLVPGKQIETEIRIPKGTTFIAGIVIDLNGNPVPNAEVNLDGPSVDIISTRTDINGVFRFGGIVPGETFGVRTHLDNQLSSTVRATAGMGNVVVVNDLRVIPSRRGEGQ